MTVLAEQRFDSFTDGASITVSAPWSMPTGGTVPVASSAAAVHGAMGCRWASTSAYGRIDYDFGAPITAARVLSFYFVPRTFATVNQYVAMVEDNHTSGQIQADWRINTARTVSVRNAGTAIATSSATLATGTVYRAEWKLDPVAHTQELRIYQGESETALIDLSGSFTSTIAGVLTFGSYTAASGGAIDYDTVKVADAWTGPEVPPATPTPVLRLFRYHSGQWM